MMPAWTKLRMGHTVVVMSFIIQREVVVVAISFKSAPSTLAPYERDLLRSVVRS